MCELLLWGHMAEPSAGVERPEAGKESEETHRAHIWLASERKFEPFLGQVLVSGSGASIHRWASHLVGNIFSGYYIPLHQSVE